MVQTHDTPGTTASYNPPDEQLSNIGFVSDKMEDRLSEAGFDTVGDVREADASREELQEIDGIGKGYSKSIRHYCGLEYHVRMNVKTLDEMLDDL